MGTFQLFENFFDDVTTKDILPGRLVWVPTHQIDMAPRILELERASPEEHAAVNFKIVEANEKHFKDREKLPIAKLKLGPTEEALITKAKKRLCVVMAAIGPVDKADITDKTQQKLAAHLTTAATYIVCLLYTSPSPRD